MFPTIEVSKYVIGKKYFTWFFFCCFFFPLAFLVVCQNLAKVTSKGFIENAIHIVYYLVKIIKSHVQNVIYILCVCVCG